MTTIVTRRFLVCGLAALVAALGAAPAAAQPFGTFTWQLQPFCNQVTLSITRDGTAYTLDGFDDQCGAPQRAPVVGTAVVNLDGSVGLGLAIVTTPGGRSVHVDAQVSPASGAGTWRDSEGNSGTFALGAATGGSERPFPTSAPVAESFIDVSGATLAGRYGFGVVITGATPSGGAAIFAQWGEQPPAPVDIAAAVRGVSRDEGGVVGASSTSVGVTGVSHTGTGVGGQSVFGPGVFGISEHGPAVRALALGTGAALELNGAVAVSGAVRPAFQHTATVGTISGNLTRIDHPLLNGNALALVYVTHVYGPGANVYVPAVGVYYDGAMARWTIYREDQAAMPASATFNVLVVIQ